MEVINNYHVGVSFIDRTCIIALFLTLDILNEITVSEFAQGLGQFAHFSFKSTQLLE